MSDVDPDLEGLAPEGVDPDELPEEIDDDVEDVEIDEAETDALMAEEPDEDEGEDE